MSSPSFMQYPTSRPNTPNRSYPDRIRLNTPYPEMANYMYQPPYSPVPFGYPPARYDYSYPVNYNIPAGDMNDGAMDYNNAFAPSIPYPYPMYYPTMAPRRYYNNNTPYRTHDIRHHREDIEEINEKRAAHDHNGKVNKSPRRADDNPPTDLNPDSLKSMLYDTLQQEMSALEVLKQQIASFTLLTHTLEEKSQIDRMGRSATTADQETPNRGAPPPQFSTTSDGTPLKNMSETKQSNFIPQFDSQAGQGVYAMPAQNMQSPLTSMNFINPSPYYAYKFPNAISETNAQQQPDALQYHPYAYYNNFASPTPTPNNGRPDPNHSSFVTMNQSGLASTNLANPGSIPVNINNHTNPYSPLPMEHMAYTNFQQQQLPIYSYNNTVRHVPAQVVFDRSNSSYTPEEFHDIAIKTLYDVEDKLKEAEEKITEKIHEFETEVSAKSLTNGMNDRYYPFRSSEGARRSMERGRSTDMNPSMVKELAVRALQAIDRRLRAAERTIDKTINNFDGMDGPTGRAVKSSTREVGVQTPVREVAYDSDTDESHRFRNSDS